MLPNYVTWIGLEINALSYQCIGEDCWYAT